MVTKVIGDWTEEMALKAVITNPTFIGEIGIGAVNVSETELGLLEGAIEGANKLQIGDVLIQWGVINVSAGGTVVLTFPTAYTSAPNVISTDEALDAGAQSAYSCHVHSISTTVCTFETRRILDTGTGTTDVIDNNLLVHWIAIGINTA